MTEGDDGREIVESAPIPIESFRSVYIEMYYFPPDAELTRERVEATPRSSTGVRSSSRRKASLMS
jgi:hypothetical protein